MRWARWAIALAALALAAFVTIGGWQRLDRLLQRLAPDSPHERYARSLEKSGLAGTALGADWLRAGRRAVERPVSMTLPFAEDALVDRARPLALGYAVPLQRGQKLNVTVAAESAEAGLVFIDVFAPGQAADRARPVSSAKSGEATLSFEPGRSGTYTLRIQPELLRGGRLRVTTTPAPALGFPVSGGSARSIQSMWGDPRDAGQRRHEGVDIFAPRGTRVVAAGDGLVVKVGENRLGGRVVWVWDRERRVRMYYAHLDEQLVRTGTFVRGGDTIGTVGNTGNARTTPAHLHFGIYAVGEGAIDPQAFIRPASATPKRPELAADALGEWARTRRSVALRAAPSPSAPIVDVVPVASALRVEGASSAWMRTTRGEQETVFVPTRDINVPVEPRTP